MFCNGGRNMSFDILDYLEWREICYFNYFSCTRAISALDMLFHTSLGGRVLSKWRTCSLSNTLEALMTTRNWLY
ncbi:hypothetical protein LINPERHAP1_LOCUS29107 [Linum perenne]